MVVKRSIVLILILLVLILSVRKVSSQERYWIALNFEVEIESNGLAIVKAKFHPFTSEGKSLYGDPRIGREIVAREGSTVEEILLMFTSDPTRLKYRILSHTYRADDEIILCDVGNVGKMSTMIGAYVLEVAVYLNTSEFIRVVEDNVYEVVIRDSYTHRDPRSWIDILLVKFTEDVTLMNYTWIPASAHGPLNRTPTLLLWVNYNELQAPDYYVFFVKIPHMQLFKKTEVSGRILNVTLENNVLKILVENNSTTSGYFYLRAIFGEYEQTVKVYINAGDREYISIPLPFQEEKISIELLSDNMILDQREVMLSKLPKGTTEIVRTPTSVMPEILRCLSIIICIIGIVLVLYSLTIRLRKRRSRIGL